MHSATVPVEADTLHDPTPTDLAAVLQALDTLVASAEPAVVFTSVVRVCVPLICQYASVTMAEPDQLTYAITWPGESPDRRDPGATFVQTTTITGPPTVSHPGYRGQLTLHFVSPPTAEHEVLARLVVDRATALVHQERLTDLVIDATVRGDQLTGALASNRDIGVAIGIMMGMDKVTRKGAFDALRGASQRTHRRLRDIAVDLIETGTIEPLVGSGPATSSQARHVDGSGRRVVSRCAS